MAACGGETSPTPVTAPVPTPAPVTFVNNTLNTPGSLENTDVMLSSERLDRVTFPSMVTDDFTLATDATITEARWQGMYCQLPSYGSPVPAVATGFVVRFYEVRDTVPFTLLREETYPIERTEQRLQQNAKGCDLQSGLVMGLYDYTVHLDTPVVAAANVRYGFSVQALMPASGTVRWGWRAGAVRNGLAWGQGFLVPRDLAFALR